MVTKYNFVFSLIHCQESLIAIVQVQVNCKKSIWNSDQEEEEKWSVLYIVTDKYLLVPRGDLAYQLSHLPQLTSAQIAAKIINKTIINNQ